MNTYYEIRGPETEDEGLVVTIDGKEKLVVWQPDEAYVDTYAVERDGPGPTMSDYLTRIYRVLVEPLRNAPALLRFGLAVLINNVLFFLINLNAPFVRGWRLETVRRYALDEPGKVPAVDPASLLRYHLRGLVLVVSRAVYYLPLIVVSAFSGMKLLRKGWEVAKFLFQKMMGTDSMGYIEFFFVKVLPEATVEIVLQFIFLSLYLILIWPVYRVLMIRYATGRCGWTAFFSMSEIRKSIGVFRRNADAVYGIYAVVISLDIILLFFLPIYTTLTLGLLWWTIPVFILFLRFWTKGVAYGYLGKQLIDNGEL